MKYIYHPGVGSNYPSIPDSVALSIVGDIDIRWGGAPDDVTPAGIQCLGAKRETADIAYALFLLTTGKLRLTWTTDGTTIINKDSTVAIPTGDGAPICVKATLDVDNGSSQNDVRFYTKVPAEEATAHDEALDNDGWGILGSVVTTAGVTSIHDSAAAVTLGLYPLSGVFNNNMFIGKTYAFIIKAGIDGTTVLDVDPSAAASPFTSFAEQSPNGATVTLNYGTSSGRRMVVVDRPMFLLGTDDYLEVPDHADLDFAATDSFTVAICCRLRGTSANQPLLTKKSDLSTAAGWSIDRGTGGLTPRGMIADGTVNPSAVAPSAATPGELTVFTFVRNVPADTITVYKDAVAGTPVTDTTTATLANAVVHRVGALSGGTFGDMVFVGAAVFRKALNAAEVAQLVTELKAA